MDRSRCSAQLCRILDTSCGTMALLPAITSVTRIYHLEGPFFAFSIEAELPCATVRYGKFVPLSAMKRVATDSRMSRKVAISETVHDGQRLPSLW